MPQTTHFEKLLFYSRGNLYSRPDFPCYNVQLGKCKLKNSQTMKFANYLHLQVEQLLGAY